MQFRVIPAARVSLAQYSQMIWSVLFSILIFSQPLDFWTSVGVIIVTLYGCTGFVVRFFQKLFGKKGA